MKTLLGFWVMAYVLLFAAGRMLADGSPWWWTLPAGLLGLVALAAVVVLLVAKVRRDRWRRRAELELWKTAATRPAITAKETL